MTKRGMVVYAGVYGKAGERSVRMLFFFDTEKPLPPIVGGMSTIKSWYYDYPEAKKLAESVMTDISTPDLLDEKIRVSFEDVPKKYVAIILSPVSVSPPIDFGTETAWNEIAY